MGDDFTSDDLTIWLQTWTIRILTPVALHGIGLHQLAVPLAVLPPLRLGQATGPHLALCRRTYFTLDKLNNAEWQTHTVRARSDGGSDNPKRLRPSPTADIDELADLLGPSYFTYTRYQPRRAPGTGKTTEALAAFHAYASAALAHQIARRRQSPLNLTEALNHPTYRAFRTRPQNAQECQQDGLRDLGP